MQQMQLGECLHSTDVFGELSCDARKAVNAISLAQVLVLEAGLNSSTRTAARSWLSVANAGGDGCVPPLHVVPLNLSNKCVYAVAALNAGVSYRGVHTFPDRELLPIASSFHLEEFSLKLSVEVLSSSSY